ncbi:MAG: CHAT domain-containing protein [Alphaproteobacteria bacterium]|jgi:CHAT domain-containing protein
MFNGLPRRRAAVLAAVLLSIGSMSVRAQPSVSFVPPPRSISDITAILDQQKPDAAVIADRQRIAGGVQPEYASKAQLFEFYTQRSQARLELGRSAEALADAEQALANTEPGSRQRAAIIQSMISLHQINREPVKALELLRQQPPGAPTNVRIALQRQLIRNLIVVGDIAAAERELEVADALITDTRSKASPSDLDLYGGAWQGNLEYSRGLMLEVRGKWKEAEASYAKAEAGFRDAVVKRPRWPLGPSVSAQQQIADVVASLQSRTKREQGRLAEAEVDARRALLNTLTLLGKYHQTTVQMAQMLGFVLRDQGRFEELEKLSRVSLEILQALGTPEDADSVATSLNVIANALRLQNKWTEADEVYAIQERAIAGWSRARGARYNEIGRVLTLYAVGRVDDGLKAASAAVEFARRRSNEFELAVAEGNLGIGLALAGRDPEGLAAFRRAVPVLVARSSEGDDDGGGTANRRQRLTARIFEAHIALQARSAVPAEQAAMPVDTFPLADMLRGRSVASALAASSARVVSQDSALAELARREQDLRKQLAANTGLMNNLLSLPPAQRDDKAVEALRQEIARSRDEHGKARLEIGVRFPAYADLIDPKPATAEQVRAALRRDEAFLSFYFGADKSFVWVVPKVGPAAFAVINAKASDIEAKVKKLREALEPNITSVGDIPAFDLALAAELYALLLKPVEATWRPAKNLVVATNGALGLLPLGVLPTASVAIPAESGAAFAAYRGVPWLARTHAVSLVPSAAAFRTLRQLPAGASGRQPLIGFGDPVFNHEQAADALKNAPPATTPSGMPFERRSAPQVAGLASATLGSLPALPDTADELRSVAKALKTDDKKVLNLGKAASEENVARADLSNYRVVAFATHGLVAGELDGLHQPALALSAPSVTGGDGDGLLTLEKILGLKLDADWVVLSACNTGAGDGAGAEAASGLGRAFFYAGTRAILVTNWSVHSQSARDLVTDLFRRQAADSKLTRAEALREAMTGLMDGPGFTDDKGKTVFTYAHPLFWAPYTLIGDGG